MDHDFEARQDRNRVYEYKGTEWDVVCTDPYGFWYVTSRNGRTPEVLKGAYTSFITAEQEIAKYVQTRPVKAGRDPKTGRNISTPELE